MTKEIICDVSQSKRIVVSMKSSVRFGRLRGPHKHFPVTISLSESEIYVLYFCQWQNATLILNLNLA